MQSIRVNILSSKEKEIDGDAKIETEDGTYSHIQRVAGVTLFHESADRIALIARRVKLPQSPLIERSARVRPVRLACVRIRTENRARITSGVFSSLRSSSCGPFARCEPYPTGRLTRIKERIVDTYCRGR